MASQLRRASSGPFTPRSAIVTAKAKAVICVQLALRFRRFDSKRQRLTWSTSAPLRGRAPSPYPASYAEGPTKESVNISRVPVALRPTGVRFLDHLVPTGELGLPYGRLTRRRQRRDPSRGCHVPHARDT